jgi:hypothetical protein
MILSFLSQPVSSTHVHDVLQRSAGEKETRGGRRKSGEGQERGVSGGAAGTVEHVLVLDSNFLNALDPHPQVLHVVIPLHAQLWKAAQTRGRGGRGGRGDGGEHGDKSKDMHVRRAGVGEEHAIPSATSTANATGTYLREVIALKLEQALAVDEVALEGFAVLPDLGVCHDELAHLLHRHTQISARSVSMRHTGRIVAHAGGRSGRRAPCAGGHAARAGACAQAATRRPFSSPSALNVAGEAEAGAERPG